MLNKMLMVLLFILFVVTLNSYAQMIYGKVLKSEDDTPIYGADVFLVNTNEGCATDKQGVFKIENITPGNYFLAVHHIGYENKYFQVTLYEGDVKEFLVKLDTKILEGEEVQITAKRINWDKYYEIFERCFIGLTSNADKCYIQNPLVLNFSVSEDNTTLKASADEMLQIANYSLGYYLDIILERFEYSFSEQKKKYLVYPRFKEMEPDDKNQKYIWEKNRRTTYRGSLEHFLSTVLKDISLKEGFKVYEQSSIGTSLYTFDISDFNLMIIDSVLNIYSINFDSHLQIKYPYFAHNTNISGIEANTDEIVILQNGYLFNPLSLTVFGKWADYGVADMLPQSYDYYTE